MVSIQKHKVLLLDAVSEQCENVMNQRLMHDCNLAADFPQWRDLMQEVYSNTTLTPDRPDECVSMLEAIGVCMYAI